MEQLLEGRDEEVELIIARDQRSNIHSHNTVVTKYCKCLVSQVGLIHQ